jgi:hypothetical protein
MKKKPPGIEVKPDGTIIAEGHAGTSLYAFQAAKYALKLRATGLSPTRHFPTVKQMCKRWNVNPSVRTYTQLYEVFLVRERLWAEKSDRQDVRWLTHGEASPK